MHREEIQNLLSHFGFAETLNKTFNGVNITHMMHRSDKLKKLVEYNVDHLGIVNVIWAFDISADLSMIENIVDFEVWLSK